MCGVQRPADDKTAFMCFMVESFVESAPQRAPEMASSSQIDGD